MPEPRARDEPVIATTVVELGQGDQIGVAQMILLSEIAQFECRFVVTRVLIVDDPHPRPLVEQVRGQQVVVARHPHFGAAAQRGPQPRGQRRQLGIPLRQVPAPPAHDGEVAVLRREDVEVVRKCLRRMQGANPLGHARQVPSHVLLGEGPGGNVGHREDPSPGKVVDDGRGDAHGRCTLRVAVFGVPVDREESGRLGRDAHDEVALGRAHPQVGVRQTTS